MGARVATRPPSPARLGLVDTARIKAMARVFMIVVAGGLGLLAGGVVYLGAFPPSPAAHQVERTLPNDGFHAR